MTNVHDSYNSEYLPENWLSVSIGEVSDVIAGGTPQANDPTNFANPGTGIAWLTPADLSGYTEKYISHGARDLSQLGYDSSSAKLIPAGSLLFSSRAPIGYVAIAKNELSTSQGFKNFVFPKEIDPNYAYYFLLNIRGLAESLGTGTTFKEISGITAKTLPFILAPFAEQKVIADKLDTLFAQVKTSKDSLERIPNILKLFRECVLSTVVNGNLTDNCNTNRNEHTIKLGDAGVEIKTGPFGSVLHKSDYLINSVGIPVINPMHISEGKITPSKSMTISEEKYNQLEAWHLQVGDVVLGRRGEMGRAVTIREPVKMLCGTGSMILRASKNILPEYLEIILRSPAAVSYFNTASVGSTMVNLNQKIINELEVYIPNVDEQSAIINYVKKTFALADNIEQKANTALDYVNKLTQSILDKAFNGELTAEWRVAHSNLISGDNSAEVLLKKIKTQREIALKR